MEVEIVPESVALTDSVDAKAAPEPQVAALPAEAEVVPEPLAEVTSEATTVSSGCS